MRVKSCHHLDRLLRKLRVLGLGSSVIDGVVYNTVRHTTTTTFSSALCYNVNWQPTCLDNKEPNCWWQTIQHFWFQFHIFWRLRGSSEVRRVDRSWLTAEDHVLRGSKLVGTVRIGRKAPCHVSIGRHGHLKVMQSVRSANEECHVGGVSDHG